MKSHIVIPARLHSTRLHRKLLLAETGKPLIQHTYEAACRASKPRGVTVAADGDQIAHAVHGFGGHVIVTDPDLATGTDRVAAVAAKLEDIDSVVNVQGDEPEIEPEAIDAVVELLEQRDDVPMATLATPIHSANELADPACVKVVVNARGEAMYFSRSVIPHQRNTDPSVPTRHLRHVGLYAYRRDFLLQISELPQGMAELSESLEQLRVLEAGHKILVGVVEQAAVGIDTPEDYRAFVERMRAKGGG